MATNLPSPDFNELIRVFARIGCLSFSWQAALLTLLSAVLIFRFNWNVIKTLAAAGAGGLLLGQIG